MSREYDVMVAGHLCFDIIPHFEDTGAREIGDILRPGKLVNVGDIGMSTGGPVSNTGIALKLLDNKVCFSARVGDDDFGKLTIEYLTRTGSADGIRVVPGAVSAYTVVIAPPNIDRMFIHNTGTNDTFCADDLKPEMIARCRHFHFGYPPLMRGMFANGGAELEKVMRIAKDGGATTSLDMSLPDPASDSGRAPWADILARVLPHVDIFLPSVEEALYMLEPGTFRRMKNEQRHAELIDFLTPEDYSRLAAKLLALGVKMTALKAGHRGIYFRTKPKHTFAGMGQARPADPDNWSDRELWCPAFDVQRVASATGSGDSAIAGFLSAFLKGLSVEEALRCGNCLGWQNIQVLDAVSGIRDWDETCDLLKQGLEPADVHIDAPGWTWDDELNLWLGPSDNRATL